MRNIWINGMMGLIVGDALGMPVQFISRKELKSRPVKTMEGYGTYNLPPGTWSDDSSMALATFDSIREKGEVDYADIMERFVRWTFYGEYTPEGKAFDQGNTCMEAICNFVRDKDYKNCGKTGEWANGNGALMRIMPACLYAYEKVAAKEWELSQALECVHQVSALTHNHLRSKMACGIYYFMVSNIIEGDGSLTERLQKGVDDAVRFYYGDIANYLELAYYTRLFYLDEFLKSDEDEIRSSGYVVDSLEAAVWSLIATDNFEEALLKAVNLGDDADTVGAIAGGLAGLYYGYENVPDEWKGQIIRGDEIIALCEMMEDADRNLSIKLTSDDLEDGTRLEKAIKVFNSERTKEHLIDTMIILRDSYVWIPCNAIMSEADQARFIEMIESTEEGTIVGKTFSNNDNIRMVPDILQKGEFFFFPVFSNIQTMGEYGNNFSKVQKHFLEAVQMAKTNEKKLEGIVINAFSDPMIIDSELFEVIENMKSSL